MTDEEDQVGLSPTVLQIIEQFSAAMCADDGVDSDASGRLQELLRSGCVPKPEEISVALFSPPPDGASDSH